MRTGAISATIEMRVGENNLCSSPVVYLKKLFKVYNILPTFALVLNK
jgi:hypothetical protein